MCKNKFSILLIISIFFNFQSVFSQELFGSMVADTTLSSLKSTYKMKPNTKEIEANFLSSYYEQDGNNSPVTGGVGTEALHDFANVFILNVPIDSVNSISLFGGADAYTSASSDNIDSNVSSASMSDTRGYGTLSYTRKNLNRAESYGIHAGYSQEFDYVSFSTGFALSKEWNEGNTELNFSGQAFFDTWRGKDGPDKLIYPEFWLGDVYGYQELASPRRNSYNGQLFLSQVLNTRLQVGLSAEFIYMTGLLSTPFHAVFFKDKPMQDAPNYGYNFDIERLPSSRLKIPFGIRLNYFALDFLVLRTNYRYYSDDFGIKAHTFDIETPIKISSAITVSPFYRYHTQTASKYFAAIYQHLSTEQYYTTDYDLSELYSHKFGAGIKYYPTYGILRSNPVFGQYGVFMFKYIELRAALYQRSTNFNAFNVSVNLGFSFK